MAVDLVLSSGFLAFAAQAGVLKAVEDVGIQVFDPDEVYRK